jgi:hypothetical protein
MIKWLTGILGAVVGSVIFWWLTHTGGFLNPVATPAAQELEPGYDFIQKAPTAKWSNGSKELPFPGDRDDKSGFVYWSNWEGLALENGEKPVSFLETHPQWIPHGLIEGSYGPFRIGRGLRIDCAVGFLLGAQGTDGVIFRIEFKGTSGRQTLHESRKALDGKLDEFQVDLGAVAGEQGYVILSVDAGDTSARDWAVWKVARVLQ